MENKNETNPDALMHHFRGRKLKSIILFTVIVHVVVIGGTSLPFLIKTLTGPDTEAMSEEDRIELAVKEATASLQKIAEEHGIRPQKLSDQFAGKRESARPADPEEVTPEEPTVAPETVVEAEEPKSKIEKQLEVAEPGPELPPIEEAVNLFE